MTLALAACLARSLKFKRNCSAPLVLASSRWCPNPLIHKHVCAEHAIAITHGTRAAWPLETSEGPMEAQVTKNTRLDKPDTMLNEHTLTPRHFTEERLMTYCSRISHLVISQQTNKHIHTLTVHWKKNDSHSIIYYRNIHHKNSDCFSYLIQLKGTTHINM